MSLRHVGDFVKEEVRGMSLSIAFLDNEKVYLKLIVWPPIVALSIKLEARESLSVPYNIILTRGLNSRS